MNLSIDIKVEVKYDEETKEFTVLSCNPVIIDPNFVETTWTHTLSDTQIKFGILTLGAKIGKYIPKGHEIKIVVNGSSFCSNKPIVTHKSVKGRIDGLTEFYKVYPKLSEGTKIEVLYDLQNNVLKLAFKIDNEELKENTYENRNGCNSFK